MELTKLFKVANGKNRDIYLLSYSELDTDGIVRPSVLKVTRYTTRQEQQVPLKRALQCLFPSSWQSVINKEESYLERLR